MPQRILDSCERTSLKGVFEVVIRMHHECVFFQVCVWFGLRLLIWSWHYGVKLVFFFSPPLPRKLLPPSGTGLWKAGQVSPTRMAWKYTRIYPAVLSLSLKSAADYKHREQGWWVEWNTEEFDGSNVETPGGKNILKNAGEIRTILFCSRFESKFKDAIIRLSNVLLSRSKRYNQQGDAVSGVIVKQVRLEKETDGLKERIGSELQWLVCVVNFLLPSEWRNSIDSLLSKARAICITYSPLSLPVASASPSASVYSVRPGPCWIAPLLCHVDSPVRGWALIALVLCWVRLCAMHTP